MSPQYVDGKELDAVLGAETDDETKSADRLSEEYNPFNDQDASDVDRRHRLKPSKSSKTLNSYQKSQVGTACRRNTSKRNIVEVPEFDLSIDYDAVESHGEIRNEPKVAQNSKKRRRTASLSLVVNKVEPSKSQDLSGTRASKRVRSTRAKQNSFYDSDDDFVAYPDSSDEEATKKQRKRNSSKSIDIQSAKKSLGATLVKIITLLRTEGEKITKANRSAATYWSVFRSKVTLSLVPDYDKFVPESRAMWLEKIKDKAARGAYSSAEEFMKDVRQIAENAMVYNGPNGGEHRAEFLYTSFAPGMLAWFENRMQIYAREIKAAEDKIASASAEKPPISVHTRDVPSDDFEGNLPDFDPSAQYG